MSQKSKKSESCIKENIFLQYAGWEICLDYIRDGIITNYNNEKGEDDPITELNIYLKPEEAKAYYVVNQDYAGAIDLFAL